MKKKMTTKGGKLPATGSACSTRNLIRTLIFTVFLLTFSLAQAATGGASTQQDKPISGKVTDSTGAPLPGVTVVVKGTTTGITTDNNGDYTLPNVPGNATLQFSFVGMKTQEIIVGNQTVIDIKLADETIGIQDVVVTALGIKRSESGAILVTTKNGSTNKSGITVDIASNTMFTAGFLAIPKKQSVYGRGTTGLYNINSDNSWGAKIDGSNQTQWDPFSKTFKDMPYLPVGKDNFANFLEQGYVTNNNINVAYKGDILSLRSSVNWTENKGQYPNSKLDKYTYAFGGDINLDKFKLSSNLSYAKKKSPNLGSNGYTSYDPMYVLLIWSSADFNVLDYKNNYWYCPTIVSECITT